MTQTWTDNPYVGSGKTADAVMKDINENFASLKSSFSGSAAPASPVLGQFWPDTANGILKQFNGSAWVSIYDFVNGALLLSIDAADIDAGAVGTAALANLAVTEAKMAAAAVSQAKLKTSTGSVSRTSSGNSTLPGGEFGFYPRVYLDGTGGGYQIAFSPVGAAWQTLIGIGLSSGTGYASQRYITSSGERHWIYLLRDENGRVLSQWEAPDHACFGNGGKPLITPHPFPDVFEENGAYYEFERDPDSGLITDNRLRREIIVINPSMAEVRRIIKNQRIADESKPDLGFLQSMDSIYELDELHTPAWDDAPVTVGLPDHDAAGNIIGDYRFAVPKGTVVAPMKKSIPRPDVMQIAQLKSKQG